MTDIRAAAANAAREWLRENLSRSDGCTNIYNGYSFEVGYTKGHAAGYADGARAFAEWSNEQSAWRREGSIDSLVARFLAAAPGTDEVKP
jgi:hypothetical protein